MYKAFDRETGKEVAIKVRDEWKRSKHPKEMRIIAVCQGHPCIPRMVCWYDFKSTRSHAIACTLYPNTDVEKCLFGNSIKIRRYMYDLLEALKFLHSRNVLYRDVKPSNILWNEKTRRATLIDFDVATFFDPVRLHR